MLIPWRAPRGGDSADGRRRARKGVGGPLPAGGSGRLRDVPAAAKAVAVIGAPIRQSHRGGLVSSNSPRTKA